MAAIFNPSLHTITTSNDVWWTATEDASGTFTISYSGTDGVFSPNVERKETMNLYTYAVVYQPSDKEDGKPAIVIAPTHVLAKSEDAVKKIAVRLISKEYEDRLDDCKVLVRGF